MKKIVYMALVVIQSVGMALALPALVSADAVASWTYNGYQPDAALAFENVTGSQATVRFLMGSNDSAYSTALRNRQIIEIQYRPWNCSDDTTSVQPCPLTYAIPTERIFTYQDGVTGGPYSYFPAPITLTNLLPNTRYRVWLGYDNGMRCVVAPCPSTTWNPEVYSFTTTSSGNNGYGASQLVASNVTSMGAQVSLVPGNDEYATRVQSRYPLRVRYAPTSSLAPGYLMLPSAASEKTFPYAGTGYAPLPVTLDSLSPNTRYTMWIAYDMDTCLYAASNYGYGTAISNPCVREILSNQSWTFTTLPSYQTEGVLTQKLYLGVRSTEVQILEQFLYDRGYLTIAPDTYFGTATLAAVRIFQRAYGLTPDGVVGQRTRSVLNQLLSTTASVQVGL